MVWDCILIQSLDSSSYHIGYAYKKIKMIDICRLFISWSIFCHAYIFYYAVVFHRIYELPVGIQWLWFSMHVVIRWLRFSMHNLSDERIILLVGFMKYHLEPYNHGRSIFPSVYMRNVSFLWHNGELTPCLTQISFFKMKLSQCNYELSICTHLDHIHK